MANLRYAKQVRGTPKLAVRSGRPRGLPAYPRWGEFGRVILFAHLLLSPLVFYRGTLEVFEYNKVTLLRGTGIVLLGLGLAAWIGRSWREFRAILRPLIREPIVWGVVLFLLSAALSTITSISPRTSFWGANESYAGLFTVFAYAVMFFGTLALCRTAEDCRRLTLASILGAVTASAYALLQVAHLDPVAWQRVSEFNGYVRPFATLGHANLLAAYLVMALPFIIDRAVNTASRRRWSVCAACGSASALGALVVGLSLSRGGWLALSVVLLVLAIGWGWILGRRRTVLAFCVGVVGVVCMVGLALSLSNDAGVFAPMRERCRQLIEVGPRQHIWTAGLAIFREHPVWGCGQDTFQLAFPAHRTADFWRVEWNQTPTKAHNELIHILATQGIVGGIAVIALMGGLGHAFVRAWRRGDRERRAFLIAVAASLAGFCVQGLFSFTVAGTGTLFVTLAALLVRMQFAGGFEARPEPSLRVPARKRWELAARIGIGVGAAALVLATVVRPWQANVKCGEAEAAMEGDSREAVAFAQQALALDGTQDVYWVRLGSAWQVEAWRASNPRDRQYASLRAREAFEQAVQMVPVNAYHHANLGRALAELALLGSARPEEAYAEFDAALALDGANAYIYADAGKAALRLGDVQRARSRAEKGLQYYPDFGPLRALLGYLAIAEESWQDAARFLSDALEADWHGDGEGRSRVLMARDAVRNRLSR
jgi:O-antigen ligase